MEKHAADEYTRRCIEGFAELCKDDLATLDLHREVSSGSNKPWCAADARLQPCPTRLIILDRWAPE